MQISQVRVKPEVAALRQGGAGTTNVLCVFTFSAEPVIFLGEVPPEVKRAPLVVVEEIDEKEFRHRLAGNSEVRFGHVHSSELRPYFQGRGDALALLKNLDDVDGAALRDLYEEVLGTAPHGNKKPESLRAEIREAFGAGK